MPRGRAAPTTATASSTDGARLAGAARRDRHRADRAAPRPGRRSSGSTRDVQRDCRGGLPQPRPAARRRRAGRRRLGLRRPDRRRAGPRRPRGRARRRRPHPAAAPLPRAWTSTGGSTGPAASPAPSTRSPTRAAARREPSLQLVGREPGRPARPRRRPARRCRPPASSWPAAAARRRPPGRLRRRPGRPPSARPTRGWTGSSTSSTATSTAAGLAAEVDPADRPAPRRGSADARRRLDLRGRGHRHRRAGHRLPPALPVAAGPGRRHRTARSASAAASPRRRACTSSASGSSTAATRTSSTAPGTTPTTWSRHLLPGTTAWPCAPWSSDERRDRPTTWSSSAAGSPAPRPRCCWPGPAPGSLVLERSPYGSDTLSTHGLMRAGVLQLSRWGLLDQVVAAGTRRCARTTFHYGDDEPVRVSIRPQRRGRRAVRPAAAPCSTGSSWTRPPRPAPSVRHGVRSPACSATAPAGWPACAARRPRASRVGHARVRGRRGRDPLVRGPRTVGRPGRCGGPLRRAPCGTPTSTGLGGTGYEWAYGDGVAAGLIPTNDGQLRLRRDHARSGCARCGSERSAEDALRRRCRGWPPPARATGSAAHAGSGRFHGWAGRAGYVRRPWGPGWALVGDAGYFKDPISTHGMTDALRDAELLADRAARGPRWRAGRADGARRVPPAPRHRVRAACSRSATRSPSYDWDGATVQPLLRRISSAMTDEVELLESLPRRRTRATTAGSLG